MTKSNNNYTYAIKLTSELTPYINNARTHSDEQVSQIAASIKEFGFWQDFTARLAVHTSSGLTYNEMKDGADVKA